MEYEILQGRIREALGSAKEAAEIPGEEPDSGSVLIAGEGAGRVLGALLRLRGQMPKLVRTIRGEDVAAFERDLPVAVIELRNTGTKGHELRRSPSHRPWGLEDLAIDLLSCRDVEAGGGGEFHHHLVAPAWLGIGAAVGESDDAHAVAGVIAVVAASSSPRLGLSAVAAAMSGSLHRLANTAAASMRKLLMAESDDLDQTLELAMGTLSLLGDREEHAMRSLLDLPCGARHQELIEGYSQSLLQLAEQGMRRLLDFHGAVAGRAFDVRKLTAPEGISQELLASRPIRNVDSSSLDPEADTWKLVALELADGLLPVEELHRRLLLDFPGLGIHAVCSMLEQLSGEGTVQLLPPTDEVPSEPS